MAAPQKNKKSRNGLIVLVIIILFSLVTAYKVFGPATGTFTNGTYLYVHTGSDYEKLKNALQEGGFVTDMFTFNILAKQLGLPTHIHAGKYKIEQGMSNYNIIRLLHSGKQTPVKLAINKLRTKRDLVTLLSANLEADSAAMWQLLQNNDYLSQFGLDTNTAMCAIVPDTYDFFWNITADKAFRKIEKNYTRFWTPARDQQAKDQGVTRNQAIIIASIVDEETNLAADKPNIASVYLNRIRKGMKLQADPTVKFAIGDFAIRRITGAMLQTQSPYNTYMYTGLPPGPICTPAPGSIEAVLNAPRNTYLYFCAKDDFSGYSAFASTFEEQMKNAHAYQNALNARGIH